MSAFNIFQGEVKDMLSSEQVPGSEGTSWDGRRICIAIVVIILSMGIPLGGYKLFIEKDASQKKNDPAETIAELSSGEAAEGSFIIHFDENLKANGAAKAVKASAGTLVKVRLLNTLKTFDTVPVFAQVLDYSLGKRFLGWTLVGDAGGDSNTNRIKMDFQLVRNPRSTTSYAFSGQALSLDGTLGIPAEKLEGMAGRSLLGAARSGTSSLSGSDNFSSFLLKALIKGIQQEASSDLNPIYNQASALSLKSGQEFFIQLTEDF